MKKCTWCGKEYPDDAIQCAVDGEPLAGGGPAPQQTEAPPPVQVQELPLEDIDATFQPQCFDLRQVEGAFVYAEGYSRPDWKVIRRAMLQTGSAGEADEQWTEAGIQWLMQLQADLGGEYRVRRSKEFLLLSALDESAADRILLFAENTLTHIYSALKTAAWQWKHGKHVILLFAEIDDYYQYVSYFYEEGFHPTSGGCLIHRDYVHIAMAYGDGRGIRRVLAHELTHNSVVHLRLPLWLNEGLAVLFERAVADSGVAFLDHDLTDRHLTFWNPQTIQQFWSGVSFQQPGESNELSYSLAEIVVNLLLGKPEAFVAFVGRAHWRDGGQTAACDCLGADLGQILATFLGEGDWRPNRKAMVQAWDATRAQADQTQTSDPGEPESSAD